MIIVCEKCGVQRNDQTATVCNSCSGYKEHQDWYIKKRSEDLLSVFIGSKNIAKRRANKKVGFKEGYRVIVK